MAKVFALVAGEASGDQLGAALITAIRSRQPGIRFAGIGGPRMKQAGMDCWWDCSELSVMGLFEVVSHLPRLVRLRRQLVKRLTELDPDVFIGIDAPDFNLGIEKKLRARSIPVIHYVSPTVWAWRPGRVKTVARAAERVLCLFPFEPDYYAGQSVQADYTGHPMADAIDPVIGTASARAGLGLGISPEGLCVALLPGSRLSEVEKLARPFLDAARILDSKYPGIRFLVPAATAAIGNYLKSTLQSYPGVDCQVFESRGKQVMAASNLAICASGTATLELMLVNRPMVVCYRLSGMTHAMAKWLRLVKSRYFALPNILAGECLVPELLQDAVTGPGIAEAAVEWLERAELRARLSQRFTTLHETLRVDAAEQAADAVMRHVSGDGV